MINELRNADDFYTDSQNSLQSDIFNQHLPVRVGAENDHLILYSLLHSTKVNRNVWSICH